MATQIGIFDADLQRWKRTWAYVSALIPLMRILFCNDSFPGHFESLATHFASDPANEVLFASRYERRDFALPGVRRIQFRAPRDRDLSARDPLVAEWTRAVDMGRQALVSFTQVRSAGYAPDMVLFSAGNGVSLFVERVFPESFRIAYLDSSSPHRMDDADSRAAALMVQGYTLFECHRADAFSSHHRDAFPQILRSSIGIIPLAVDTDFFRSEASSPFFSGIIPRELVSIAVKDPGILAGSGLLRVVTALLLKRPFCHVLLVCGFGQSAQLLRVFSGLGEECLSRLHACEFLRRPLYRDMLCCSTVHVCPRRHGGMLVELLETMSCGTVLLAPLPCGEDLVPGSNMLAWPETPQEQFKTLCRVLDDAKSRKKMGGNARQTVLRHYDQKDALPRHAGELLEAYREWEQAKPPDASGGANGG
ncbi:MAG: hypothetical protein IKS68_07270 [Mailhella sp.]|nr:hypothetical protein [Mailhella sp.]